MTSRSLVLAAAALAACHNSSGPTGDQPDAPQQVTVDAALPAPTLQMNDLAVLLPLPTTATELSAMLSDRATGSGGLPLIPPGVISLMEASVSGTVSPEPLVAVAIRLDPCFGQIGTPNPSTCQAQLRIVFQDLKPCAAGAGTGYCAFDSGLHALYDISNDQLVEAARSLAYAREAANGSADLGPLAVSPIVAQQGLDGSYAQALVKVVTRYCSEANLARTAVFQEMMVGTGTWNFGEDAIAGGAATGLVIPSLPNNTSGMALEATVNPLTTGFGPATQSADNLDLLATFSQASSASGSDLQAAFDAALRVENPQYESPLTIDCESCHMAQPAIQLVGEPLGLSPIGNPNAFAASPDIPAADLAQTATELFDPTAAAPVLSVHAFSYRAQLPVINQRVINDTAASLAYVNTMLIGAQR